MYILNIWDNGLSQMMSLAIMSTNQKVDTAPAACESAESDTATMRVQDLVEHTKDICTPVDDRYEINDVNIRGLERSNYETIDFRPRK